MDTKVTKVKMWADTGEFTESNPVIARLNADLSLQHNIELSSQTTLNSKYPFHIRNSKVSYYSGSCKATFIDNSGSCYTIDGEGINGVAEFNYKLIDWLHNGDMKYMQISSSTVFPIGVLNVVTITPGNDSDFENKYDTTVGFDWEQVGDMIKLLD